jgi:hypothetical protein
LDAPCRRKVLQQIYDSSLSFNFLKKINTTTVSDFRILNTKYIAACEVNIVEVVWSSHCSDCQVVECINVFDHFYS